MDILQKRENDKRDQTSEKMLIMNSYGNTMKTTVRQSNKLIKRVKIKND